MPIDGDAEIRALRTVLRDLVALSAIPVAWVGREPAAVAAGLADVLTGLLRLDFVFVRLCVPGVDGAVDVTRGTHGRRFRNGWKTISPRAAGSQVWTSFPTLAASSHVPVLSSPSVSMPRAWSPRPVIAPASRRRLTSFCCVWQPITLPRHSRAQPSSTSG